MTVERISPDCLAVPEGQEASIAAYIESDFKIRSGLCPNGDGLMTETDFGQECPVCHFSCNTKAEKGIAS
jgi:hypothetical protein